MNTTNKFKKDKKDKKDKFDAPINSEYAIEFQKEKAEKALKKAKELEKIKKESGKKLVRLNSKTIVLR